MCVVSMVSDHYFQKYPQPYQWKWHTWQEYQELKRKAEEYDRIMKQQDCFKDNLELKEQAVLDYFKKHDYPQYSTQSVSTASTG